MAYRQVRGKTTGNETYDVHAARWKAWRAAEAERRAAL